MPALTPEQLEHFDRRLAQRHAALRGELRTESARSGDTSYGDMSGEARDAGDDSVADLLTDVSNAEITRDVNELRDVEAARRRIQEGTYGQCIQCGTDIPLERLEVQPAALRCTDCQEQYDRTHAGRSRPTL